MQYKHLVDAEHDTQAHGDSGAWFLLLAAQDGLCECEQHVEHDAEAETPVDFYVRVIGQVNAQVVPRVLISASGPLQALVCLDDLVIHSLVGRVFLRAILFLQFINADIDFVC